eukprot:13929791-Alexandrium_andersonii.AAC.1
MESATSMPPAGFRQAPSSACIALTQAHKKYTGTWDGALMVLAPICCPEVRVLAAREVGGGMDEHFSGAPK